MRASHYFISTLKEAPSDAEVTSQKLMLRAGLIKRAAAGIYTWMPMGLRVLRKVESIVREEMNRAGAVEILMPAIQPAELWQESGRWEEYGPELLRLKDRHQRDFVIGPTHEEVITDVMRREIKSYKQLPRHFFQIQTKFRDEIRPRFGVMRGREFIMKDGYSFHASFDDLKREYENMYATYTRIFTRLGLQFRAVAADPGSIGGTGSHEFHVIAETGEDDIAYCPESDFAANVELAEAVAPKTGRPAATAALTRVHTPGVKTIADLVKRSRHRNRNDGQGGGRRQRRRRTRAPFIARRPLTQRDQGAENRGHQGSVRPSPRPNPSPPRLAQNPARSARSASPDAY